MIEVLAEKFGVVGDGVHDDTDALNAALTEAYRLAEENPTETPIVIRLPGTSLRLRTYRTLAEMDAAQESRRLGRDQESAAQGA